MDMDFDDLFPLWETYQDKRMAEGWKIEKDRHPSRLACHWRVGENIVIAEIDDNGVIKERIKKSKSK